MIMLYSKPFDSIVKVFLLNPGRVVRKENNIMLFLLSWEGKLKRGRVFQVNVRFFMLAYQLVQEW